MLFYIITLVSSITLCAFQSTYIIHCGWCDLHKAEVIHRTEHDDPIPEIII